MKTRHWAVFILGRRELAEAALGNLKEQYPVTAHAPNFDFWTGCREIKRCEESRRTLKNPFATRLAVFDTALKPLSITDRWYILLRLSLIWTKSGFFVVTFIAVGRRTKSWEALWCRLKAYFFCQLPYKPRNCERNTYIWNSNNRHCKKETIETWMWLRRSCGSFVKQNVLQRRVCKL